MRTLSLLLLIFILACLAVVCTGCSDTQYEICKKKYSGHLLEKRLILRCLATGEAND